MTDPASPVPEWGTLDGKQLIKGFTTWEGDEEVFHYSPEWNEALRLQRIKVTLASRGVEPTILDRTLADYKGSDLSGNIPLLQIFIDRFDDKFHGAHIYLWSRFNGTQKSTTAKVIAKDLAFKGKSVWFITMGELSARLKNKDFSEDDALLIETLMAVDFLVVDDAFDVRKMTLYKSKFQLSFLDVFFRERLEVQRRATCFTSNFPVSELTETFGISLKSLIDRSTKKFEFNDTIEGQLNVDQLWQ